MIFTVPVRQASTYARMRILLFSVTRCIIASGQGLWCWVAAVALSTPMISIKTGRQESTFSTEATHILGWFCREGMVS